MSVYVGPPARRRASRVCKRVGARVCKRVGALSLSLARAHRLDRAEHQLDLGDRLLSLCAAVHRREAVDVEGALLRHTPAPLPLAQQPALNEEHALLAGRARGGRWRC
eukprot:1755739-Pleurochrysis_carterae.AAC.1